ncbi:MAG: RNA polymerase sigma factor (sigma-70 family) [Parvicella sp.]
MIITPDIIAQVNKGNQKVILKLYHHTFNVLMSTAVRYKVNEEDQMTIVNNSFIKIVNNIEKFRIGTAYFSWAKRIVTNEAIDDFRKNSKYKELFNTEVDLEWNDTEVLNDFEVEIEAEVLQKMLNQLPPATKIVFNLFAIDGLDAAEICDELKIGKETVKWHLKSARKNLRKTYRAMFMNETDE